MFYDYRISYLHLSQTHFLNHFFGQKTACLRVQQFLQILSNFENKKAGFAGPFADRLMPFHLGPI